MGRAGFEYKGPVLNAELGFGILPQANPTWFCFPGMLRLGGAGWWGWGDFLEHMMFKVPAVCTGVAEKICFILVLR